MKQEEGGEKVEKRKGQKRKDGKRRGKEQTKKG